MFPLCRIWSVYNGLIAFLLALVTLTDASLYEFWEFKLDKTVFFYLGDLNHIFSSVSVAYVIVRLAAVGLLSVVYYRILQIPVRRMASGEMVRSNRVLTGIVFLLLGGGLFVTIRGLNVWPNTPHRAFFSTTAFHNHAALNPLFNLFYSVTQRRNFSEEFNFFDEDKRQRIYAPLFPETSGQTEHLLRTPHPNILLIVLEGFGAVFVEELGGMKEVAPNIGRLSGESVFFTQCYSSSFRTDRGIVAILGGYPGQPTNSIIRFSRKIQHLPALPKTLREYGYDTQVLYAGDMSFFNMMDYFVASGHDKLVSQEDFPASARTSDWGVPDHVAFEWLYEDIRTRPLDGTPWYTTFLTLSSHAPWDVPYRRLEDEKSNAFAYVDDCLGTFIDKLKQTPAWDNLLVVCIADHGFNRSRVTSPDFSHIPFLFLGGAVEKARRIDKIVCQTDLPATLLGQLGIPHEAFVFSRDVLSDTYIYPFSFNTFNNGFIFCDTTGCTVYDNDANRALTNLDGNGAEDTTARAGLREEKGKAILQTLYDDLDGR